MYARIISSSRPIVLTQYPRADKHPGAEPLSLQVLDAQHQFAPCEATMIRTIRPLDRSDPGLQRVANAVAALGGNAGGLHPAGNKGSKYGVKVDFPRYREPLEEELNDERHIG